MDNTPAPLSDTSIFYCAEDAASWDVGEDSDEDWARTLDLSELISAETEHMPRSDYLSRFHPRSLNATARQDCINWILEVNEFYHFRPVTSYLSVNYLDRFLSEYTLPEMQVAQDQAGDAGWAMQLLSVASLSIAAKMEETEVPPLLDLQILEPKFVFESSTIRRMELVILAALHWRMRSVTPFDFLPNFAEAILPHIAASRAALFSRTADLIISTRRVTDFLKFRPSTVAAAALLCAAEELFDYSAADADDCLSCFSEWVRKDVLGSCYQLISQYIVDTCPSSRSTPSADIPPPHSPVGVLDAAACGSCDSRNSSDAGVNNQTPPLKRRRLIPSVHNM